MKNNGMMINFNRHLQENFWLYIISLLCIFTGMFIGIYTVKYMGQFEQSDLLSYLKSFTTSITTTQIDYRTIFIQSIKNNIVFILAIWFLGLTMIGIPVILILNGIKGFTIGFTISFMINALGMKGIGVALLGILPQNIIYVPCIIIASVFAMEFSLTILKDRINKQGSKNIWVKVGSYSFSFITISIVMAVGFVLEAYITSNMVRIIINNIGSVVVGK